MCKDISPILLNHLHLEISQDFQEIFLTYNSIIMDISILAQVILYYSGYVLTIKSLYKPIKPLTPFKANLCLNLVKINGRVLKAITNTFNKVFILSHIFKAWSNAFRLFLFFTILVNSRRILTLRSLWNRFVGPRFIFIIVRLAGLIFGSIRLSAGSFFRSVLLGNCKTASSE